MNWEAFKKKFHPSWHKEIKPFIESKECDEIFRLLKERSLSGEKIAPTSHNTFKAFEVPLDELKVVVLGERPYDGFVDGFPVANGIYLDCSSIQKSSYELMNFYRGLEVDLFDGLKLDHYPEAYNLKFLTDQGVMMMTAALTVEAHGTHDNLWVPFTTYVMGIIKRKNIPVIFIGESTQYASLLNSFNVYKTEAIKGTIHSWDTKGVFVEVNRVLEEKGKETIMWLQVEPPF
jgi:uracil-DNA glycosylase